MRFRFRYLLSSSNIFFAGITTVIALTTAASSLAQDSTGFHTDPATGLVYRKVQRTIDRPVVETQMRTQESTIYRPETTVTTRPETRTVYSPVVSYGWEPKLANRWNPFSQPTVVYQHTPRMHWEARTETVERQETHTNYVAETRKYDVPQQVVRMQREVKEDLEPVGRVAPQSTPPNTSTNSEYAAISARLRPIDPNNVAPLYAAAPPVASVAAYPPRRNQYQSGIRANELYPTQSPGYGAPLPPASTGYGVAGLPLLPVLR